MRVITAMAYNANCSFLHNKKTSEVGFGRRASDENTIILNALLSGVYAFFVERLWMHVTLYVPRVLQVEIRQRGVPRPRCSRVPVTGRTLPSPSLEAGGRLGGAGLLQTHLSQ